MKHLKRFILGLSVIIGIILILFPVVLAAYTGKNIWLVGLLPHVVMLIYGVGRELE